MWLLNLLLILAVCLAAIVLLGAFAKTIVYLASSAEREKQEQEKARAAEDDERRRRQIQDLRHRGAEQSSGPAGNFCLLLRSSKADSKLSAPYFPSETISDRYQNDDPYPYRFRRYLYERMQPVVVRAIKNPNAIEELVAFDYGSDWRQGVARDMADCAFMLAIPMFPSEALKWELDTVIAQKWHQRLYFVMPPLGCLRPDGIERFISMGGLNKTPHAHKEIARMLWKSEFHKPFWQVEMMESWLNSLEELAKFGIRLGKYNESGGLFMHRSGLNWDLYLKWNQVNGNVLRAGACGTAVYSDFRIDPLG